MTILFESDWAKYPNAIPDLKTKNESFIRLARLYKEMGLSNYQFPLALHNPKLQGIDPHDENIDEYTAGLIAVEAKMNYWYYLRECVRVPPAAGDAIIPFRANRRAIAVSWLFFNHITCTSISPRQTGKSTDIDVLDVWLLNIRCLNTSIALYTKDDALRQKNIQRIKNFEERLPYFLKQRTKNDPNLTDRIFIGSLDNSLLASVSRSSEKDARNLARGLTNAIFTGDEIAYCHNVGITIPAALAAGGAAREIAREANEPYGTIFATTAGKRDDRDGKYAYQLVSESAEFTEKFYDVGTEERLRDVIRSNSRKSKLRVNCTFNHNQLGYSDQWLAERIEDAIAEGDDVERDFLNIWTTGGINPPLSKEQLARIDASKETPEHLDIDSKYNYVTRWYLPEQEAKSILKNEHTLLLVDPSDAGGGDDISFLIMRVSTMEVLVAGNFNVTNLIPFSQWITNWFIEYDKLIGVIENRSSGVTLIDNLCYTLPSFNIDPFKRLYNRIVHQYESEPEKYQEISVPIARRDSFLLTKYKKQFGFSTSGSGIHGRNELYGSTLKQAADLAGDKVKDKTLASQILGLVVKDGRVDHPEGEHDDMVIAWLLGVWFLTKSKNLSFYGIDSKSILPERNKPKFENRAQEYDYYLQQQTKHQINELYKRLTEETDPNIQLKIEYEMRRLDKSLDHNENDIFSIDAMIEKVHEDRRKNTIEKARNRRQTNDVYGNYSRMPTFQGIPNLLNSF